MNFTVYSSAGQSWKGGFVSIEPKVANMVADSILNIIEVQETTEMEWQDIFFSDGSYILPNHRKKEESALSL